jgi:transcription-repair coupling factor (superfamily II helicase)
MRTFISPFDQLSIREALLREKYRGGQAFYVVPKIKDQPDIAEFLRQQVPEVSYRRSPTARCPRASSTTS